MGDFKIDNNDKIICGVCAGIAKYLNADVWFIRLIALALAVIHPCVWMLYFFVWILTHNEDTTSNENDTLKYRGSIVVETLEDLFDPNLIQASYIGKLIYVKSEKSFYLLISNDYQNNIKKCWEKMNIVETKDIIFNVPIFIYLKGNVGDILGRVANGILTDSDGNIWVKSDDSIHHIDDLSLESKELILKKLKESYEV